MGKKPAGPRFIIGIDLGTTQCALSWFDRENPEAGIMSFPIPQFVSAREVESLPTLPSLMFLPDAGWAPPASPWGEPVLPIVGHLAHELGYEIPARLIHSAKSWLCHARVDRLAPILPWQSEVVAEKWSPVAVTAQYLKHLIAVWQNRHPEADFQYQKVIVTIPASFDPAARNLTLDAIHLAGIDEVTLLEEPQAAFYDFLHRRADRLSLDLKDVKTVLVVDIGGGTTDFSLIALEKSKGKSEPVFRRLAVGPHLLIGGDNIDLAVARMVEGRWRHRGKRLTAGQWLKLLRSARQAKEQLLAGTAGDVLTFTVPGAGSRVIAQKLSEEVPAAELEQQILDGFFPAVKPGEQPEEEGLLGLSEAGLPYSRDPAVTRHLAQFLAETQSRPEAILFNGGTTLSGRLRMRILEHLNQDRGDDPIKVLENPHPTQAVAQGAVAFGLATMGMGISIRSGSPVSVYLGVGGDASKKAGVVVPQQLLCLLPKGSESEEEFLIPEKLFGVDRSRDVAFYLFFANSPPAGEFPGFVAPKGLRRFRSLPPLILRAEPDHPELVQVRLGVMLRATGCLQIFCRDDHGGLIQELSFDAAPVAGKPSVDPGRKAASSASAPSGPGKRLLGQIRKIVDGWFEDGSDPAPLAFKQLEEAIGVARKEWDLPTLRVLFDLVVDESRFFQSAKTLTCFFRLAGFCLRPGFGATGDEERLTVVGKLPLPDSRISDTAFWSDWWLLWKRVAAGLSAERQEEIKGHIEALLFPARKAHQTQRKPDQHERNQLWRLLGHLERLGVDAKMRLGEAVFQQPATFGRDSVSLYALGRLGSRRLLYADQTLIVPQSIVQSWAERLLKYANTQNSYLDWALKEIGRKTGDRLTQVDDLVRKHIVEVLKKHGRKKEFLAPLIHVEAWRPEDFAEGVGDQLPNGFVWVKDTTNGAEEQEHA
jgi:molecular chaperone DnaK (HSP70)